MLSLNLFVFQFKFNFYFMSRTFQALIVTDKLEFKVLDSFKMGLFDFIEKSS